MGLYNTLDSLYSSQASGLTSALRAGGDMLGKVTPNINWSAGKLGSSLDDKDAPFNPAGSAGSGNGQAGGQQGVGPTTPPTADKLTPPPSGDQPVTPPPDPSDMKLSSDSDTSNTNSSTTTDNSGSSNSSPTSDGSGGSPPPDSGSPDGG